MASQTGGKFISPDPTAAAISELPFCLGDQVEIVKGEFSGKMGKIVYVYPEGVGGIVDIVRFVNHSCTRFVTDADVEVKVRKVRIETGKDTKHDGNSETVLSNAEAIAHIALIEANLEDIKKETTEFVRKMKSNKTVLSNDQVKECLFQHEAKFNEQIEIRNATIKYMKAILEFNPSCRGIIPPTRKPT